MQYYKYDPKSLQFIAVNFKPRRILMIALVAIIFLYTGFATDVKVNTILERVPIVTTTKAEECNTENVKAYIKKLHLRFPNIVLQQVLLESGHYQSPLYKNGNNLVGMRPSFTRPTISETNENNFAKYDTWKESLVDYALWQASFARSIKTEQEYYDYLDKIYCEKDSVGVRYSVNLKKIQL